MPFYRKTSYKSTLTPEQREARAEARFQKKFAQDEAKRAKSAFKYPTAGGHYIPTERQLKAARFMVRSDVDNMSADIVIFGAEFKQKVHHDHIHRVNEFIRNNPSLDL